MEVVLLPTPGDCGRVVADAVSGAVLPALARGGPVVLGLATGSSPLRAYGELLRRHREDGLSFAGVQAFLLDEYVGLPAGHPESYREVIRRDLTDGLGLDPAVVHGPDGAAADPLQAARDYERQLRGAGPVAVQVLGIGANGHLGFNEPGSSLASRTRVKTLTEQTRADNARFFGGDLDAVPRHVITQGLGTILGAEHLVLVATGARKAEAVAAAVEGPLTASCPGSVLQLHPHATVVVDATTTATCSSTSWRPRGGDQPGWQHGRRGGAAHRRGGARARAAARPVDRAAGPAAGRPMTVELGAGVSGAALRPARR